MEKKLLQQIAMVGKRTFYGFLVQVVFMNLLWAYSGSAQVNRILSVRDYHLEIQFHDAKLIQVFRQIEKKTGYHFAYEMERLDRKFEFNKWYQNKNVIADILLDISRETGLRFKQINKTIIVVSDKEGSSNIPLEVVIDGITITGRVTSSEDGEGLPGANVLVKGTALGTVTDIEGNFQLEVPNTESILVVSSVGFTSEELIVGNRTVINVALVPDIRSLEEIVVIGYGTQAKRDLTGSVSSIKEEKLKDMPLTSIDQGLQGLASGIQVQQQSGQPGGATSIRIRGGNSINAGNEPLYVIDGFPIYNENATATTGALNGVPTENALSSINPNDIVSVEILKDASATAIYGSRAANGVIIITTRRGKEGKSNFTFDSYYGIQDPARKYDLLDAAEFARMRNDQWLRQGRPATYTEEQIAEFERTGGTDWQDAILRAAPISNYQLSVSGGTSEAQHMFSLGYFEQHGIMINSFLKRISGRANIDANVNKRLKFWMSVTGSHTWSNQIPTGGGRDGRTGVQQATNGGIYQATLFYNPAIPIYNEDGSYTLNNTETGGEVEGANQSNVPYGNPVAYANLAENKNFSTRFLANMFGEWEIVNGLKLKVSGGTNLLFTKQNKYEPSTVWNGQRAPNGRAVIGTVQNVEWLNENILSYDKTFNDRHKLNLLAGVTAQAFKNEVLNGNNVNFATDALGYDNIQGGNVDGERVPGLSSGANEWQLLSGIFRAFYTLDDKYLFTLTGRYDGSSRFGANNKWAFFPSAAFAWRISDEQFLQGSSTISDLKLRLSWGQSGNQNIPTYRSLPLLGTSGYTIGEGLQTGFQPIRLGNPDLKWETTTQTNIGFDLGMLDNRLEFTADAYYKKTTDLLFDVPVPSETGFQSQFENIGSLENKGIELALNAAVMTGELRWNVNVNWAMNRNKVLELQGEDEIQIDANLNLLKAQNSLLLKVGEPIGNFYGYVQTGIYRDMEQVEAIGLKQTRWPGQAIVVDQNQDSLINNDDRVILGNALPDWVGGITNSFSWKNFELNFLFDFSYGNEVLNLTQIEFEFLNGRQNGNKKVLERWQPDDVTLPRDQWTNSTNPDTEVQSVGRAYGRQVMNRYVEDGSFLRLRNLTFAYNVPVNALGINWLSKLRVYFSGQNLLLFTNYSGLDPEANVYLNDNVRLGLDYAVYPTPRTYTFGVNLGF